MMSTFDILTDTTDMKQVSRVAHRMINITTRGGEDMKGEQLSVCTNLYTTTQLIMHKALAIFPSINLKVVELIQSPYVNLASPFQFSSQDGF